MRLFIKKIFQFITGVGGQGLGMSLGTDTQTDNLSAASTQSTGTDTQRVDPNAAPTVATGTDTQSGPVFNTANTIALGTDSQSQGFSADMTRNTGVDSQSANPFAGMAANFPVGVDTQSMVASASGSATYPQGTDSQSMGGADLVQPFGGGLLYDSSGNNHSGSLAGTGHTFPASVAAPSYDTDLKCNGTGAVDLGPSSALGLGNSPWTLEAKVNKTNLGAIRYIMSKWDSASAANQNYFLRLGSGAAGNDIVSFAIIDSSGTSQAFNQSVESSDGVHDIAISYDGTTVRLYVDGAHITGAAVTPRAPTAVSKSFIGAIGGGGASTPAQFFDDAIAGIRISNIARYTGTGSYTPSTTPWVSDANTVALYLFDGVSGVDAYDSSGNSRYGVFEGPTPPTRIIAPTAGFGLGLQFNGVDNTDNAVVQGVNCGTNFPLSFPNGFTLRGRFKHVATGVIQVIFGRRGAATATRQFIISINAANQLVFQYVNSTPAEITVTGTTTLVDGQVYEFECSHGSASVANPSRLLVNGVLEASSSPSTRGTVTDPVVPFMIGKQTAGSAGTPPYLPFAGILEELEISDIQRHSATYTPTGVPIVPDSNTIALWRFDETSAPVQTKLSAVGTLPLGTDSQSFAASAVAVAEDHTDAATAVQNSGTGNWTNPANTVGAFDGVEAVHAGLSGLNTACSADVRCTGLVLPPTPSGFTAGNYFIRIRHRWDLTITAPVAGVTDATHSILITDSAGTQIGAAQLVRSAAVDGTTQATLITEDIDITSIVSVAQANAGIRVYCRAVCAYVPAVNGNTSWNVDAVHLIRSFSRTGIT